MANLISCIIPMYNMEEYIERCLDSIIVQYNENCIFEVICVDDCSVDNTISIAKKYEEKYSFIKVVQPSKNLGLSGARNFGVKFSHGNYYSFVDSDDWLSIDYFSSLYEVIVDDKVDEVFFPWYNYNAKGELEKVELNISGINDYKYSFKIVAAWARLIKKEYFIEFYEGVCYEDFEVRMKFLSTLPEKYNVYYLDKQIYFYDISRPGSIMKSVKVDDFVAVTKSINMHTKKMSRKNKALLLENYIDRFFLYGIKHKKLKLFNLFFISGIRLGIFTFIYFLINRSGFYWKKDGKKTLSPS